MASDLGGDAQSWANRWAAARKSVVAKGQAQRRRLTRGYGARSQLRLRGRRVGWCVASEQAGGLVRCELAGACGAPWAPGTAELVAHRQPRSSRASLALPRAAPSQLPRLAPPRREPRFSPIPSQRPSLCPRRAPLTAARPSTAAPHSTCQKTKLAHAFLLILVTREHLVRS